MSSGTSATPPPGGSSSSIPSWLAAGLVGLAVGGGGTYLVMDYKYGGYEYLQEPRVNPNPTLPTGSSGPPGGTAPGSRPPGGPPGTGGAPKTE